MKRRRRLRLQEEKPATKKVKKPATKKVKKKEVVKVETPPAPPPAE